MARSAWEPEGEILVTAVIERIPFGPEGLGSALEKAILASGRYVTEQARTPGEPWEAEATFTYQQSTYTVRGTGGEP